MNKDEDWSFGCTPAEEYFPMCETKRLHLLILVSTKRGQVKKLDTNFGVCKIQFWSVHCARSLIYAMHPKVMLAASTTPFDTMALGTVRQGE